jgi:hypothetical protein
VTIATDHELPLTRVSIIDKLDHRNSDALLAR